MPLAEAAPVPNGVETAPERRTWRLDAAALAVAAVLLRLPAFLASRHLTFDDGQYGAVVLGLRAGELPFRDLFSSQGPLYYPLLAVADVVGLRSLNGPRLLPVAAGAIAVVATYAIGRHLGTRTAAVLAAVLVATSGSLLYVTAPLSGDGPALALALCAVALSLRFRARPSTARAIAAGVAMGAAVCIKLIVVPAAIPVGILLLGLAPGRWVPRRAGIRALGTAVASAVVVLVATVVPWGPQRVWDQSVAYHQDSERLRSYGGNFTTLLQTLAERDPFLVLAVIMGLVALAWRWTRSRRGGSPVAPGAPSAPDVIGASARWIVLPWLGLQAVFLVIEPTMWRPHVAQVVVPLALATVLLGVPSWRVVAALCIALTPWWFGNVRDIAWPNAYPTPEAAIVERLRTLPSNALVISDDPGFAWRAERRVPPNFVDVSKKRFQQGQLTLAVVGRAADSNAVCAVLIWSRERLGSLPGLPSRLEDSGFEITARLDGTSERVLYERSDCAPPDA